MANRILLIAGITSALVAGCSQTTEKPLFTKEVTMPELNQPVLAPEPTALREVSASASADTTPDYRPITLPAVKPQRREVFFAIGNDVSLDENVAARSDYINGTAVDLAPTYPDRPVPVRGTSKQEVLATIGSPPSKLPGTSGDEVWDYGTFRVFFNQEVVAFTRVW